MAIPLVTNLTEEGRRRRYFMGGVALVATLLLVGGLLLAGAPRGARVFCFVPIFVSAIGFLQGRGRT